MPKETPSKNFEKSPQKLSDERIEELLKIHPEVKLDKGEQHFIIQKKNEKGEWVSSMFIPVWKEIPRKHKPPQDIEDALEEALGD